MTIETCAAGAKQLLEKQDLSMIDWDRWKASALIDLRSQYGKESAIVEAISEIRIAPVEAGSVAVGARLSREVYRALTSALQVLTKANSALSQNAGRRDVALFRLLGICRGFHNVVKRLRDRSRNRVPVVIVDEYDMQYVVLALLAIDYPDVRAEDVVPSYAGATSRVDFLLKQERIVLETKLTSKNLGDKELGEQLLVDRARYSQHPDCDTLVCLVYDPESRLKNAAGIVSDIESSDTSPKTYVVVVP